MSFASYIILCFRSSNPLISSFEQMFCRNFHILFLTLNKYTTTILIKVKHYILQRFLIQSFPTCFHRVLYSIQVSNRFFLCLFLETIHPNILERIQVNLLQVSWIFWHKHHDTDCCIFPFLVWRFLINSFICDLKSILRCRNYYDSFALLCRLIYPSRLDVSIVAERVAPSMQYLPVRAWCVKTTTNIAVYINKLVDDVRKSFKSWTSCVCWNPIFGNMQFLIF